jgi:hypothetical protein
MLVFLLPWLIAHSRKNATWTRLRTTTNLSITVHWGATAGVGIAGNVRQSEILPLR